MKDKFEQLLEEAEIYEHVDVLGQAQSDAACMVKKLRAALQERTEAAAAWDALAVARLKIVEKQNEDREIERVAWCSFVSASNLFQKEPERFRGLVHAGLNKLRELGVPENLIAAMTPNDLV